MYRKPRVYRKNRTHVSHIKAHAEWEAKKGRNKTFLYNSLRTYPRFGDT